MKIITINTHSYIEDNYEKIILTMDKTINNDFNGIKVINIIDFLLEDDK